MTLVSWDDLRFPAPWFVISNLTNEDKAIRRRELEQYISQFKLNEMMLDNYKHRDEYARLYPCPVFYNRTESVNVAGRIVKYRPWETNYYLNFIDKLDMNNMIAFFGHTSNPGEITKSVFSQWYRSDFVVEGVKYSTCEQYMMAQKAAIFGDLNMCKKIMATDDPGTIKKCGRQVKGFIPEVWDKVKMHIVRNGNYAKFTQNKDLMEFLLSTGDAVLVEASPYDKIWGIGMSANNPDIKDPRLWRGSNLLGFSLMQVRDEIRRVYENYSLVDFSAIPKF